MVVLKQTMNQNLTAFTMYFDNKLLLLSNLLFALLLLFFPNLIDYFIIIIIIIILHAELSIDSIIRVDKVFFGSKIMILFFCFNDDQKMG